MEKKNEVFVDFQSENRKITLYIMCIGGWGGALWNMNEKTRKKGGETKEAAGGGGARAQGASEHLCVSKVLGRRSRRREEEKKREEECKRQKIQGRGRRRRGTDQPNGISSGDTAWIQLTR